MKYKLIYISNTTSSVFESQVLTYLDWLYENRIFEEILLFVGSRSASLLKQGKIKQREYEIIEFHDLPDYNVFNSVQYAALCKQLKKKNLQNAVVHIRSEKYAQAINKFREQHQVDFKIVTDIRGAVLEETMNYKNFNFLINKLKKSYFLHKQKDLNYQTDLVSVVSSKLKEYVHKYYDIDHSRIFVNHSFASENFQYSKKARSEYRKKLNIHKNEIVFIFSTGGNGAWQNTTEIVNTMRKSEFKIINLSKKEIPGKNVINLFVPHREVPNYLSAADFGIVWRNDDVVNNVASPVKFSEYASCGLPVIANNGVKLIETYISDTGYGKILNSIEELHKVPFNELRKINRKQISEYSKSKFHISGVAKGYLSMYETL